MEFIKKNLKKLLLVLAYTITACVVYGYWFQVLWNRWYITLITVLLIVIAGCVIGYFYTKEKPVVENKEEQQAIVKEDAVEENKEEIK